jgi:hypothetical protein
VRRLSRQGLVSAALFGVLQLAMDSAMATSPVLQRFLSIDDAAPHQFRALRHLEARNEKLGKSAWMDVWTEADDAGFRYEVVAEGGSDLIRSRVFDEALETEQHLWRERGSGRAAITERNYDFGECAADGSDRVCVTLTPRRKDVVLVRGTIFIHPQTGELERIEGSLAKSPSFWTRSVEIVRRYERIAGARVPVLMQSTANVRFAGRSTLLVTYQYESINGVWVNFVIRN